MSDQEFIFAPPTVSVDFAIPTVDLIMNSMHIVLQADEAGGFGEWVNRTYESMDADRLHKHRMVFSVLLMGVESDDASKRPASFPEFLDRIAADRPQDIQARTFNSFVNKCQYHGVSITRDELMGGAETFMEAVDATYGEKHRSKGWTFEPDIYRDAYDVIMDPPALKETILEHMRYMWENHMRNEWYRILPTLEECVAAFKQLDFSGMTSMEAIRSVTRRDLTPYFPDLEFANNLIFVPSAHIGPYNSYYEMDGATYVIFGARTPEGVISKSPALDRSELLVHLNALADDTRLKILELLTRTDEMCAQDIITTLDLSQSSASRHLRQLTATGYLTERRRDVAKCYTLNMKRIDETTEALRHFLRNR